MKTPWQTLCASPSPHRLTDDDFGVEVIAGDFAARVLLPPAAVEGQAVFILKADEGRGPVLQSAPALSVAVDTCPPPINVGSAAATITLDANAVEFVRLDEAGAANLAAPTNRNVSKRERRLNPQGVIDRLIAQTARRAAEIKRLGGLQGTTCKPSRKCRHWQPKGNSTGRARLPARKSGGAVLVTPAAESVVR